MISSSPAEVQKLSESASVEEYFGEVKDAEGNVVSLRELLNAEEEDKLNCFEFWAMMAEGFEEQDDLQEEHLQSK